MLSYVFGAIVGIVYGLIIGLIKYAALWRKIDKMNMEITYGGLYLRMGTSYAINVAALLFVFLFRHVMPFDYVIILIGTAVALSIAGKIVPMSKIVSHVKSGGESQTKVFEENSDM